ncbi:hypothetical protein PFICI_13983 [Pestalotiopsis fici W106-1]|uniref:C2H2-type domain-containing protein n=1 Tax=Pestalotiopsis fici (strain W106-1 / CGMCC3.15140) TaxID=1229662 RepID=W3WLQ9_PESFW|nr:uncharacterized protein PFICI_13983 [Pestalotiopsis fici W106-1]ETS74117.1 hypothetical protein PFICI_13983 [Pestalotiopsis fici W106-1]
MNHQDPNHLPRDPNGVANSNQQSSQMAPQMASDQYMQSFASRRPAAGGLPQFTLPDRTAVEATPRIPILNGLDGLSPPGSQYSSQNSTSSHSLSSQGGVSGPYGQSSSAWSMANQASPSYTYTHTPSAVLTPGASRGGILSQPPSYTQPAVTQPPTPTTMALPPLHGQWPLPGHFSQQQQQQRSPHQSIGGSQLPSPGAHLSQQLPSPGSHLSFSAAGHSMSTLSHSPFSNYGSRGHPQSGYQYPNAVLSNMTNPGGQMTVCGGVGAYHPGAPYTLGSHHAAMYPHPHQANNQTDRPYKCETCSQSFNRNHDLKRHKRIHLAVKPFPCNFCDKSFSRKDALKRHRLVKNCEGKAQENNSSSPQSEIPQSELKTEENEYDFNSGSQPPQPPHYASDVA